MADPLAEARLYGSIDQHEQITINNSTGAELAPNEVFFIENASGNMIPHVARETIAADEDGEAHIVGEFSFAKADGEVFAADDDIHWHVSANEAVTRASAKTGDWYLAQCTLAAASGDDFVRGRLAHETPAPDIVSTSSSISVSSSSTSTSSSSTSTSSTSNSSTSTSSSSTSQTVKSISSLSNSSSLSVSKSSNSDSSSSTSNSISSNSDSSTSSEST